MNTIIIVDFSQTMISNLMVALGNHTNTDVDTNLLRHMILNCLRSYNKKFSNNFGEMIIACDDMNYWRKDVFPYYKANRRKNRDESELNWKAIFESLNMIRDEIKNHFHYRVIHVSRAEADDIIGTLVKNFYANESILLLSGDKDFGQLHGYPGVQQYDPTRDKWIKIENPRMFLKEHIIRGDGGDGIPNFLSQDDSFVAKVRQKSIMQKKLDEWLYMEPEEFCDEASLRRFQRNKILIDLNHIPDEISSVILEEFENQSGKDKSKLFDYFMKNSLKHHMKNIGEF